MSDDGSDTLALLGVQALLGTQDEAAMDALMRTGFDPEAVEGPLRPRAEAIHHLLGLLETDPPPQDSLLVDVTMARVLREQAGADEPTLLPADEDALDAWVHGGYELSRVPGSLRPRARRHAGLARLICDSASVGAADAGALVGATLERIRAHEGARGERMRLDDRPSLPRGPRFHLPDLVSIAAVLLIGASVLWPVMTGVRQYGQRQACEANFGSVAGGFSLYAGENRSFLPVVSDELDGGRWWEVGSPTSNSANLFHLVRAGYAHLADLACAGNPRAVRVDRSPEATDWSSLDEISYSYQIMFGPSRRLWSGRPGSIVLTDRSPAVLRAHRGGVVFPEENSPNHHGRGQFMLATDGSARWSSTPDLPGGDNVWLPRMIEQAITEIRRRAAMGQTSGTFRLQGTETPDSPADTFVGP